MPIQRRCPNGDCNALNDLDSPACARCGAPLDTRGAALAMSRHCPHCGAPYTSPNPGRRCAACGEELSPQDSGHLELADSLAHIVDHMEKMRERDPEMHAVFMKYRELWSAAGGDVRTMSDYEIRRRFPELWELMERRTQSELTREWRAMGFSGDPPKPKAPTALNDLAESLNQQSGKSWTPLAWLLYLIVALAVIATLLSRAC